MSVNFNGENLTMTIYKTKCGGIINVSGRTEAHLKAHPEVINLLDSAIKMINLPTIAQMYEGVIDMGRIIGRSRLAKTAPYKNGDKFYFALRTNRALPSRVVSADNIGEETTKIAIIAKPRGEGRNYELITAWIGELAKKEPWDSNFSNIEEFKESLNFWNTFALIHDPKVMGDMFASSWRKILVNSKYKC